MRLLITLAIIATGYCAGTARAADVVHLRAGEGGRLTIEGEIVDYTGTQISVRRSTGAVTTYPAAEVESIDSDWNEAHRAARGAMAAGDYATAARELSTANGAETRIWARRLILADLMRTYVRLGRWEQAGDLLLIVLQSDPSSPALADAPLAWFPNQNVGRTKADSWLANRNQPAAILLGASHLLSTSAAPSARQALSKLANHQNARLALLAQMQLWRAEQIQADRPTVDRWSQRLEQFPRPLRAGGYFIVGSAYDRLDLPDDALLALLHIPLLYPDQRELAARALVAAAQISARTGQTNEAVRLLDEAVVHYRETSAATEAAQLLNQLTARAG